MSSDLSSPTNSTQDPPYVPSRSELEEMEDESDSSPQGNFSFGSSPVKLPSSESSKQGEEHHEQADNVGEVMADSEDVELTVEEIAALKEINEDGLDEDISDFLRNSENKNTKASTEAIVTKYNRVMSLIAKKTKKQFVPLEDTPREDIPNLLARFFKTVRTKKNEIYNASSYNTFLSCFGRYLQDAFEPPIDMKRDVSYKVVRKTIAAMKKKAQATKGKKPGVLAARAVAPRHIQNAWACGAIGRTNPDSLNAAGYLAFTTGLGCRAVNEVTKVPNRAVIFGPVDAKHGVPEWIELDEEWVCKNRQGNDPRKLEARINPDHDNPESCMVGTIMEIQRRKKDNQKIPEKRFWWNVNDTARADPDKHEKWFKNCVMGRHTVAKLLINALEKSGVDCKAEKYTATSARKTMMDGGLDAGIPEVLLGRKAGHRTDKSKNSYIQNKDITHRATNIVLSRVGAGLNPNYQEVLEKIVEEDRIALAGLVDAQGKETEKKEKFIEQGQFLFDGEDEDGFGHTISQSRMEESCSSRQSEAERMTVEQQQGKQFDFNLLGPGLSGVGGIPAGNPKLGPKTAQMSIGQDRFSYKQVGELNN